MSKPKKKVAPIRNDENVVAHLEQGKPITFRFGELKRLYISKELKKMNIKVVKIYHPKTNKYWYVSYNNTKGFTFEKLEG